MNTNIQFTDSKPEEGIFALHEVKQLFALWRERTGLSPKEFGELIDFTHPGMVEKTEDGSRNMGVLTLNKIAEKLGYHIEFRVKPIQDQE